MEANLPNSQLATLQEFQTFMFHKIVPDEDLQDYKGDPLKNTLPFWRRNGLLPFFEPGKWSKFSFPQLIWVRILDDLRQIGYPLEKLKLICDYFYKDAYDIELWRKNLEYNIEQIQNKGPYRNLSEQEKINLHMLQIELMNKDSNLRLDVNYFSMFINSSIAQENAGYIYIFLDGRVAEFIGEKFIGHKNFTDEIHPYICLPLNKYLEEFIDDKDLGVLLSLQILTQNESKVLNEMRRKNVKEITIYKNNKDESKIRIESTSKGIITDDEAKKIKEIFKLKNYERITLDTIDEKSLSFKMTKKNI